MTSTTKWVCASACLLAALGTVPARSQPMEIKEKPAMYSYVANWEIPRDKWKDIESRAGNINGLMDKFLADGSIVAHGNDITLIHKEGESTHDTWWSSMSWAGLLKVLAAAKSSGAADAPVYATGKHYDRVLVARYYNWRSGAFTNGYTRVATWTLKPDAPNDAIDQIAKNLMAPILEKLLADGAIYEYEIDEQAIHIENPGVFMVVLIANGPEGLDKFNAAVAEFGKTAPLASSAFYAWMDYTAHRDFLFQTAATYK